MPYNIDASTLPTLKIIPDSTAYAVDGGSETLSQQLKGGLGRYRRDQLGASNTVTCQWSNDPLRFQVLRAFYRTVCKMGSQPFLCDLVFDDAQPLTYICYFLSENGFKLMSQQGLNYVIGAKLEIILLNSIDSSYDEAVVLMYSLYGTSSGSITNGLNNLVNNILSTL